MAKDATCPNCGYCKRCGRGTAPWYPAPYFPPTYPWYTRPVWIAPVWSGDALPGSATTITYTSGT